MSLIGTNFNDVPDKILPLQEGERILEIQAPSNEGFLQPNKEGTGTNAVIVLMVVDDMNPAEKGRTITEYCSTLNQFGLVRLKQIALSAGIRPGAEGLDLAQLVGKRVKAIVKTRSYKDKDSGEDRQTSNVYAYVPDPSVAK